MRRRRDRLINTGLCRSRNAAHSILTSLCVVAVAALAYFAVGFSWQGYRGEASYAFVIGGKTWDWIPRGGFSCGRTVQWFSTFAGSAVWNVRSRCGGNDSLGQRRRTVAPGRKLCFGSLGWRPGLTLYLRIGPGAEAGSRNSADRRAWQRVRDCGGAGSIHAVGGFTALAIAWILGPRRGKYTSEGMPAAIPGHNTVLVLFGCWLAWFGWLGLDSAGAILFAGIEPGRTVLVAVNITLSAASAALAAAVSRAPVSVRLTVRSAPTAGVAGLVAASAGWRHDAARGCGARWDRRWRFGDFTASSG